MAIVPDRWVLVRVRFHGPYVVCQLTDSRGYRMSAPVEWVAPSERRRERLRELIAHCGDLATDLPLMRSGPHGTGPVPLAVFVDYPPFLRGEEEWRQWNDTLFSGLRDVVGIDRVQLVTFTGSLKRRRPAFSLPFDIVSYGPSAQAELTELRDRLWMRSDAVQKWGIATRDVGLVEESALEATLRERECDILITDDPDHAFLVCHELPLDQRPRLIVVQRAAGDRAPLPPRGTAAVWIDPAVPELRISELLFGFVHDLPIHEAVRATQRLAGERPGIRVFADPWTNQSLRIRDALVRMQTEAERLELRLPQADLAEFFERIASRVTSPRQQDQIDRLRRRFVPTGDKVPGGGFVRETHQPYASFDLMAASHAYGDLAAVRRVAASVRVVPQEFEAFEQEDSGLVPMAARSATLADAVTFAASNARVLRPLARDPDLRAILAEHQQRTVDIGLQRLDTSPLLASLDPHHHLVAGALYRLRVHVGNPLPDSLVVGERPPIDVLLPDTTDERGHLLDVVVQGKQFRVESEATQSLRVPPLGGSEPVYFAVRAPEWSGAASLRVHLYHRNHLVQSYLLDAEISRDGEIVASEPALKVSLAYTRVRKLEDAENLQPRAFSIAVNDSGRGTHEVILKGDEEMSAELTLSGMAFDVQVRQFRATLDTAARDPVSPDNGRVYATLAPGATPPADVADTIRAFARQGRALYEAMFTKVSRTNPAIRKQLTDLKQTRDKKIQVVRMDDTFAFPWNLLYDFTPPRRIAGTPEPPVCLGTVLDATGAAVQCGHTSSSSSICINGFWSIRHYIEELIGKGADTDAIVARPAHDGVRIIHDAGLPGATQFQSTMKTLIPAPNLAFGPAAETTLLDLLWKDPPERPSILVVVGHLESRMIPGEPESARVVMVPASEWLTRTELSDRALNAVCWTQPRPVVMLMACESFGLDASTINDFITSLSLAGAAAIIGAEAVVPAGLAMRCAQEMTRALWAKTTLGEAMTTFRRAVLAEGNPLAFVFNGIGSVDLTLN
jgi:hypothetical protein